MKKVLVLFLIMVVSLMVFADDYEIIDEGEIEGFFSYVSIACEKPEIALGLVGEWTANDSWVEITTQEVDQLASIDSKALFESELGEKIGVYLYLYTENNIRMSVIYENGTLYVMSDSEEVMEALRTNKDALIKGIFNI